MNSLQARRARYFLRLAYPVRIVAGIDGYRGALPDLPGCEAVDTELPRLYGTLERKRRGWILRQAMAGGEIPLPNSHRYRHHREPAQVAQR